MSTLLYTNIVASLFDKLDALLNHFVFQSYNAVANALKTPLGLAIVLYITLMGLSITQGWIRLSLQAWVKSSVKCALIYSAAMHWGWFSHYGVDFIENSASQIGEVLLKAAPVSMPHGSEGIHSALQSVLMEVTHLGAWVWDKGSWHTVGPYFTALLLWGFGFALIVVAIFELVLAKMMFALLFATAPLFIAFTLFKPTQGFFDRWLGACVGFGLLMIFVSSLLALALSLSQWAIADTYANHANGLSLVGFVPLMIVGFISVGLLLKVAQLAQGIGGTVTTASGSALLAGTVGGAMGGTLATFKMPMSATQKIFYGHSGRNNAPQRAAFQALRKSLRKGGQAS